MLHTVLNSQEYQNSMRSLCDELPHWQKEIELISRTVGESNSSICISGPHLEETTIMLRKVLAMWPIRVAFVKVSEVFWSRNQFFERILVQLRMSVATVTRHASYQNYQEGHAYLPAQRKGYRNSEKCGSSATFLETLKHIFLPTNSASQGFEKAYILLEGIEKLDVKVFGNKIIPVLLRIQELTSIPIGVIMTCACDWVDIAPEFAVQAPMLLHLPPPQKLHLIFMLKKSVIHLPESILRRISAISTKARTEGDPINLDVRTYLNMFVPLVVNALRLAYDTKRELLFIIHVLFPRYIEPVLQALENQWEPPSSAALYSHISPFLQVAVNVSSLSMLEEEVARYESTAGSADFWDLPLVCKYLILAAWIASKNPTIDSEIKDRKRRRRGGKSEASRLEEEAFAPAKSWKLDKLVSILDHILAGNEEEVDIAKTSEPNANGLDEDEMEALNVIQASMVLSGFGVSGNASSSTTENASKMDVTTVLDAIRETDEHSRSEDEASVEDPSASDPWSRVQFNHKEFLEADIPSSSQLQSSQTSLDSGGSESALSHVTFQPSQSTNLSTLDASQVSTRSRNPRARPKKSTMPAKDHYEPFGKPFHSSSLFPLLWDPNKDNGSQLEILTQIGVLEQAGLFIRSSAATSQVNRSRSEYRCGYDSSFANKIADSLNFPLWGFL